jgi:Flp pilus assembly protein TadD
MSLPVFPHEQVLKMLDQAADKSVLLVDQGRHPEAIVLLKQAVKVSPDHERCLWLLAKAQHLFGNHHDAVGTFEQYLELRPHDAEAHNNLALCLDKVNRIDDGRSHLFRAIELDPGHPAYHNNLGMLHRRKGLLGTAAVDFQHALQLDHNPTYLFNLGSTLGEMGHLEVAETYLRDAIETDPDFAAAHVSLAYALHLKGEWEEGFKEYEWRFRAFPRMQHWQQVYGADKLWDGTADLGGKRVVVYCEQGLGDMIQFARYAHFLRADGATVIAHAHPPVRPLLATLRDGYGLAEVAEWKVEDYDHHCSVMSLPHLLGLGPVGPPEVGIHPLLPDVYYGSDLKVGVIWAGSPEHPGDRSRSVHVRRFFSLAEAPGVRMYALQKDLRPRAYHDDPNPVNLNGGLSSSKIIYFGEQQFGDFALLARWVKAMDLVIAVDTAVLHLAGTLGVPTWGLIPHQPDWRWGAAGRRTPWYPTVELFRQPKKDDWDSVFEEVRRRLTDLVTHTRRGGS